jgi:hypothetical protein
MPLIGVRSFAAVLLFAALMMNAGSAFAQSGPAKASDEQKQPAPSAEAAAKDRQRKVDEFAEAARVLNGPAGHPECVWLGRRVVGLLWRDDLDTAFRHLDLYDRFGCPGGHIQATFRCVLTNGNIDPKVPEALNTRVHACWIDPQLVTSPAQAKGTSGTSAEAPGTSDR